VISSAVTVPTSKITWRIKFRIVPELHNGMAIDTWVENFSRAILEALKASTPTCCLRDDPRPPIPAGIQDEIRLKNRLRRQ